MCWKQDNPDTVEDVYALRYWPAIDPERVVAAVCELNLKPETGQMLMRVNTLRLFKLPGGWGKQEAVL